MIADPSWERFSICHDNGCASLTVLSLSEEQQRGIRAILEPPPADAVAEREGLRAAIAQMEKYVGDSTGTWRDKGGTFNFGSHGQMDCIDESINTTIYLRMFRRHGLLRFHEVVERATRGFFIFGWPHRTAVIRESRSGDFWAVDSWFHDNGVPPEVLPLRVWRDGWKPGNPVTAPKH